MNTFLNIIDIIFQKAQIFIIELQFILCVAYIAKQYAIYVTFSNNFLLRVFIVAYAKIISEKVHI